MSELISDWLYELQDAFENVVIPFFQPYVEQFLNPDIWNPLHYFSYVFKGEGVSGWFYFWGLVLLVLLFFSVGSFESVESVLFGEKGDRKGIFPILGMCALLNLSGVFYTLAENMVFALVFHSKDAVVWQNNLYNPLGMLLLTVVVMHGFSNCPGGAFLFTAGTAIFAFWLNVGNYNSTWIILFLLEALAGAIIAAVLTSKKYLWKSYIAFSVVGFAGNWIEMIFRFWEQTSAEAVSSHLGEVFADLFSFSRPYILITLVNLAVLIFLERHVVGTRDDAKIAMSLMDL